MNLVAQSIKAGFDSIRQSIVDIIFDYIVEKRTRETIRKCIQANAKVYMIQRSQFGFKIFRKADVKHIYGMKKNLTHLELSEAATFVAHPDIHNLKNYKRNGRKRIKYAH
ncbi:MAG: hypothetical protein ACTSSP_08470 [Candidatus Asgardarchaeia archaeon]